MPAWKRPNSKTKSCCCCRRIDAAVSLPSPAVWRPFIAATSDAWQQCCCCRHLWRSDPLSLLPHTRGDDAVAAISCGLASLRRCCSQSAATLPSLLTPLRRSNPPSLLLPTLPSPATWRPSAAATADTWRRYRRCHLLWRGNPPSPLPPKRGDAAVGAVSTAARQPAVVAVALWRGNLPSLLAPSHWRCRR